MQTALFYFGHELLSYFARALFAFTNTRIASLAANAEVPENSKPREELLEHAYVLL